MKRSVCSDNILAMAIADRLWADGYFYWGNVKFWWAWDGQVWQRVSKEEVYSRIDRFLSNDSAAAIGYSFADIKRLEQFSGLRLRFSGYRPEPKVLWARAFPLTYLKPIGELAIVLAHLPPKDS